MFKLKTDTDGEQSESEQSGSVHCNHSKEKADRLDAGSPSPLREPGEKRPHLRRTRLHNVA